MAEWNPEQYLKFKEERTHPAVDLAQRMELEAPEKIADIGCGPGNSTRVIKNFYPQARVVGFDNSPQMLKQAQKQNPGLEFRFCDVSSGLPELERGFDAVFSNACLQWVPDHPKRIAELLGLLKPGGKLAVQIPMNYEEPVHRIIAELSESPRWCDRLGGKRIFYTLPPEEYYDILSESASSAELWQTTYYHVLPSQEAILEWYRSTGLRPYLDALPETERPELEANFMERIRKAYPPQRNGKVIFRFPRFFFLAVR